MTRLNSEAERLFAEGRSLGSTLLDGWWAVRNVDLVGGDLVARFDATEERVVPSSELLADLLGLWIESDGVIDPEGALSFASRYGLLGVRYDGTPSRECESLADWRDWIREARAILNLAGCIRSGDTPTLADRDVLEAATAGVDIETWRLTFKLGKRRQWTKRTYRRNLALRVNRWLALGKPTLVVRWPEPGEPEFITQSATTFGAIALSVAAAITKTDAFKSCRGCGAPFTGRKYCSACQAGHVPERDASRAYRARSRGL